MRCVEGLAFLMLSLLGTGLSTPREAPRPMQERPRALAVIVNPKNPITNLSFNELRSHLRLDQQFWPDKERVELFLRPDDSPEMGILLEQAYRMSADELDKFWIGKIFRGEIRAKPKVTPNAKATLSRVLKVRGALGVVLAGESTTGARVLTIDGKRPGEPGYPLFEKADGSTTRVPDEERVVE